MREWVKKLWKKHKVGIAIFVFIIIAVTISILVYIFNGKPCLMRDASKEEIDAWLYFVTGLATAALAVIAYVQISQLNTNNSAQFLLRIDERWGSREILEARTIIHKIYVKTASYKIEECDDNAAAEKYRCAVVGKKIKDMSKNKYCEKTQEDFIKVLNFLDFMETIGFLCKEGKVTKEQLDALCGESLIWTYQIFACYIKYKNKKRKPAVYYENFKKLWEELEKNKKK